MDNNNNNNMTNSASTVSTSSPSSSTSSTTAAAAAAKVPLFIQHSHKNRHRNRLHYQQQQEHEHYNEHHLHQQQHHFDNNQHENVAALDLLSASLCPVLRGTGARHNDDDHDDIMMMNHHRGDNHDTTNDDDDDDDGYHHDINNQQLLKCPYQPSQEKHYHHHQPQSMDNNNNTNHEHVNKDNDNRQIHPPQVLEVNNCNKMQCNHDNNNNNITHAEEEIIDDEKSTMEMITQARQKMNSLLQKQKEADKAIIDAKQKVMNAQNHLLSCESNRQLIEQSVNVAAEELTDRLLKVKSTWNEMYWKLVDYYKIHGNCDVKRTLLPHEKVSNPEWIPLSVFVGRNRLEARKPEGHPQRIEPYKVIALNRIGFNFDPKVNYWMDNYDQLKKYMAEHGQGEMPSRRKSSLGVWCDGQINAYNKFMAGNPSYITQKKIELLNEIGFIWDRNGSSWMRRYQSLKGFYNITGHCRVPKSYHDKALYRWIGKERTKYRNYINGSTPCQTEEQFHLLGDINFMAGIRLEIRPKDSGKSMKTT